ncbi:MAG: hypothetical protein M1831_001817 [Alyxoria varia]|nr:MAG: hypothetical protein M1831_001817 [Alyxoria varia]
MVKPLAFKGDKKPKKRKRAAEDEAPNSSEHSSKAVAAPSGTDTGTYEEDDTWVTATEPGDLSGPIIIVLPTSPPSCIATDMHGRVFASALENLVDDNPESAEPHNVRQVWVANRVAGTESVSLKGHHGKYLGCDKYGIMSATREAVSLEEQFYCVPAPEGSAGMFALKTGRDTHVGVGNGEESKELEKTPVRGDKEEIKVESTLRIRMQARYKPKLKVSREEKARERISRKELEEAVGRRLEEDEVKRLKKARREGNYHEALLDVKVKGKHDKFA